MNVMYMGPDWAQCYSYGATPYPYQGATEIKKPREPETKVSFMAATSGQLSSNKEERPALEKVGWKLIRTMFNHSHGPLHINLFMRRTTVKMRTVFYGSENKAPATYLPNYMGCGIQITDVTQPNFKPNDAKYLCDYFRATFFRLVRVPKGKETPLLEKALKTFLFTKVSSTRAAAYYVNGMDPSKWSQAAEEKMFAPLTKIITL
jgi:hypothetical protein